jgi:methionine synthase I (cobalamin-dependent)
MTTTFLKALATKKVLLADGATGTQLQKAGLPVGVPSETWNITNPDAILAHYRSYIDAGSDIILTNTFGGTPIKLALSGLEQQTVEINSQAALLARQAAGPDRFVFGDVGPTGKLLQPYGDASPEEIKKAYAIQIKALADACVDAILIETMSSLEEATLAVTAAKEVCSLPILVTFSFDTRGRTMMGVKPAQVVNVIWPLGIAAIGINCGKSLLDSLTSIQEMKAEKGDIILMAKPNAGLPKLDGDQSLYDVTPEIMAEYAQKFISLGVKILGTCCGSTPDHIRAIRVTLK